MSCDFSVQHGKVAHHRNTNVPCQIGCLTMALVFPFAVWTKDRKSMPPTIRYQIGSLPDATLHMHISKNTGAGFFNDEWVPPAAGIHVRASRGEGSLWGNCLTPGNTRRIRRSRRRPNVFKHLKRMGRRRVRRERRVGAGFRHGAPRETEKLETCKTGIMTTHSGSSPAGFQDFRFSPTPFSRFTCRPQISRKALKRMGKW